VNDFLTISALCRSALHVNWPLTSVMNPYANLFSIDSRAKFGYLFFRYLDVSSFDRNDFGISAMTLLTAGSLGAMSTRITRETSRGYLDAYMIEMNPPTECPTSTKFENFQLRCE
jgi:hypothetical protein